MFCVYLPVCHLVVKYINIKFTILFIPECVKSSGIKYIQCYVTITTIHF